MMPNADNEPVTIRRRRRNPSRLRLCGQFMTKPSCILSITAGALSTLASCCGRPTAVSTTAPPIAELAAWCRQPPCRNHHGHCFVSGPGLLLNQPRSLASDCGRDIQQQLGGIVGDFVGVTARTRRGGGWGKEVMMMGRKKSKGGSGAGRTGKQRGVS
ncbi:unnamed protein product, partial [Sphacelaria rigidula]